MRLNINTDAVVRFTNQLEQMHRSALPSAIRGALNDAVFNVKTVTMPKQANVFKKREPNFFKANSKFENAVGFDINKMQATVGFFENKLQNRATNHAVEDLEEQEKGGSIDGRSFVAMKAARAGRGKVRPNARMANIKKVINAKKVKSVSGHSARNVLKNVRVQKLIRAAIVAKTLNPSQAFILGNPNAAGSQTLFRVEELHTGTRSANKTVHSRSLFIRLIPLYRVKKDREVIVSGTSFMQKASLESAAQIEKYFIAQAKRQFKKFGVTL